MRLLKFYREVILITIHLEIFTSSTKIIKTGTLWSAPVLIRVWEKVGAVNNFGECLKK